LSAGEITLAKPDERINSFRPPKRDRLAQMRSMSFATNIYTRSQLRMDASFFVDAVKHTCVIEASTEVRRDIARIFAGYLTREFGENAFKVKRIPGQPNRREEKIREQIHPNDDTGEQYGRAT